MTGSPPVQGRDTEAGLPSGGEVQRLRRQAGERLLRSGVVWGAWSQALPTTELLLTPSWPRGLCSLRCPAWGALLWFLWPPVFYLKMQREERDSRNQMGAQRGWWGDPGRPRSQQAGTVRGWGALPGLARRCGAPSLCGNGPVAGKGGLLCFQGSWRPESEEGRGWRPLGGW